MRNLINWLFGNNGVSYRRNGDVDFDPRSRYPSFVQYNNARQSIQQAKCSGKKECSIQLCTYVIQLLIEDGYEIEYRNYPESHDLVKWGKNNKTK